MVDCGYIGGEILSAYLEYYSHNKSKPLSLLHNANEKYLKRKIEYFFIKEDFEKVIIIINEVVK